MNLPAWITLLLEREQHLDTAQAATFASQKEPKGTIAEQHLQQIAEREIAIAQFSGVILDALCSPKNNKTGEK